MPDSKVCKQLFNDTLAIEPTDGSLEAREYGLELARKNLDWLQDNLCGLEIDSKTNDFICSKRFTCPLNKVIKVEI